MYVCSVSISKNYFMYNFFKQFHSGWAYLTLLMGILFFLMLGYYAINKKARDNAISKLSFFTTLTFHIQLILGLVLYFLSPFSKFTSETMGNSELRLYAVEHPLMMFAGVIFITIANSKLKKSESVKMSVVVFALIGLLLTLSKVPWADWLG